MLKKCDLLRVEPENSKISEYCGFMFLEHFCPNLKSPCGHFELKIANKFVKLTLEWKIQNDAYDGKIQNSAIFAFVLTANLIQRENGGFRLQTKI